MGSLDGAGADTVHRIIRSSIAAEDQGLGGVPPVLSASPTMGSLFAALGRRWFLALVVASLGAAPALAGVLTVVLVTAYGGLDELTQPAVNRTADWPDFAADVAGGVGSGGY